MDLVQQKNIFRLSAILYAKTNSIVSDKNIVRKVIEDALYCCGLEIISITHLIEYINDNYALLLSSEEIREIVENTKNKERFIFSYKDGNMQISLTEVRKNKVTIESQQPNLLDYISEFVDCYQIERDKGINLILRYLYDLFTSNLDTFKKLLKEGVIAITAENHYLDEEKETINEFLLWERPEKDKAIFDLANYALEYCMLTNSKNTDFNLQNLKYKNFYLDTNILFRAIGLNGEDLKNRTLLFLSKFKDVQENLLITSNTNIEFNDSLNYYIGKLEKSLLPRFHSELITEYLDIDSFYYAYHRWSVGRENNSVEYFRMYLVSELDALCDRFNIVRENDVPYDEEKSAEIIEDYISGIRNFALEKNILTAEYDAKNILWVERMRRDKSNDIYDTKHFFLSSDKSLYCWDYTRKNNSMLVVMPPSQWIGIILRYVERTSDDYKSFICFLTMKVTDSYVKPEKILSIVKGIDEMTHDLAIQKNLLKSYIQTETEDKIMQLSEEEIEIRSKAFAEKELDKRIKQLEEKNKDQETHVIASHESIVRQQSEIAGLNNEVRGLKNKIQQLKGVNDINASLLQQNNLYQLKLWKLKKTLLWLVVILMLGSLVSLFFFWKDWEYNYVYRVIVYFDSLDESIVKSIGEWLIMLPISGIGYSFFMIYDAVVTKTYHQDSCHYWTRSKPDKED